ncbi:hypothetical protein [Planococcus maitriensis]|uniref:hypothetical protein n=1 Tax=Planococcus maitriensis TaxID=221799 RepID=UPI00142D920C|nr:hypothetical protein [Planococcus maitriensis]
MNIVRFTSVSSRPMKLPGNYTKNLVLWQTAASLTGKSSINWFIEKRPLHQVMQRAFLM